MQKLLYQPDHCGQHRRRCGAPRLQLARTLQLCGSPGGGVPLRSYTGVDVSAPALALAARHLAFLQPACQVALVKVGAGPGGRRSMWGLMGSDAG